MTTASDNFNRTENPLSTGWAKAGGTGGQLKANGTAAIGVGLGDQCSLWTADAFGGEQYSEAVLAVSGTDDIGVAVRGSTSASQFYLYDVQGGAANQSGIYKYGGTYVVIGALFGAAATVGHTYRIESTGSGTTTLTVKDNGVTVTTRTDASSPFTSGRPGVYVANAVMSWDSWNGGDIGGGANPLTSLMGQQIFVMP